MTIRLTLVTALQQWADRHEDDLAPGVPEQLADAYRAEVLAEAADVAAGLPTPDDCSELNSYDNAWDEGTFAVAKELRRMASAGKDTRGGTQPSTGESTQPAPGTCGRALSTGQPCPGHPFVPRTERSYWVTIADALNAAATAGMPVGINMEGILTDHNAWAVVWNREQERWEVGGYDDDPDALLGGASPAEPTLAADDPGMTTGELLRTPKSSTYCATPGCGHGGNVHGPFCFAAGCDCADFTRGEVSRG